jgi:predicted exporter
MNGPRGRDAGRADRRERLLAIGWLLLVIALIAHQVQFWRASRLDTDVMALLPTSERTATADRVLRQLTDGVSREIVVLVGARTGPARARRRSASRRPRPAAARC